MDERDDGMSLTEILCAYDLVKPGCSKEHSKEVSERYRNAYFTKVSGCAACGQPGRAVGRNFRPCRTSKEWVQLENRVQRGLVNLELDFYEYPREIRRPIKILND